VPREEAHAPRAGALATVLATLTGTLYLVAGTLVFAVAALVAAAIPPRGHWHHRVGRAWAKGLLAASFVRLEVTHEAAPDPGGSYVFTANHQSLFDIPALLASLPGETKFLAKSSLFRIPVFGWALHAGGFVPIDRKDRSTARESFAAAVSELSRGVSVLIFPEEERTLDGRVLPFQRGGFLLALKSGLPIVPVGIEGAFEVQHRRSFLIRPGTVHVRYGRPIAVDGESVSRLRELAEATRRRVAELARAELSTASTPRSGAARKES